MVTRPNPIIRAGTSFSKRNEFCGRRDFMLGRTGRAISVWAFVVDTTPPIVCLRGDAVNGVSYRFSLAFEKRHASSPSLFRRSPASGLKGIPLDRPTKALRDAAGVFNGEKGPSWLTPDSLFGRLPGALWHNHRRINKLAIDWRGKYPDNVNLRSRSLALA